MTIILSVLGGGVVLVILILCAAAILAWIDTILIRYHGLGQQAQWEKDQRQLCEWSNWFSEDEATMELIRDLALRNDISSTRERWRKARASYIPNDQGQESPTK